MTKASENIFPLVEFAEGAAPATPSSGQVRLYAKADGLLYSKDDAGSETGLGGGGGGLTQAYVGYDTAGGSRENITSQRVYMKKVTIATACLITDIEAYVDWQGPNAENASGMNIGLFEDNAGSPRYLLQSSNPRAGSILLDDTADATANGVARWYGVPLGRWVPAGDYWIAVQFAVSGALVTRIAYDGSGSDRYYTSGGAFLTDAGFYTVTIGSNKYSIRANTIR